MLYQSTRGYEEAVRSTQAMLDGLAPDGGLYLCDLDAIKTLDMKTLLGKSYQDIAFTVLQPFFSEIDKDVLKTCIESAYNAETFQKEEIVPVVSLPNNVHIAEIIWGRTMAFKDVALSLFPYLLQEAKKIENETRVTSILTATSGDTGKAAMEGFRDIDGIEITVFYPEEGVSPFQKLQMQTQEGDNVHIYGIDGNFDDAQAALKKLFQDPSVAVLADKYNKMLASANSINIGRLFPQIVYYVTSYLKAVESHEIAFGDEINIVVPTGNFGNIFAGFIAMKLGIPIGRFISASNDNDVLADFFESGIYDVTTRNFKVTSSPSMDILISSNFERYLYAVLNQNAKRTKEYMEMLQKNGKFSLAEDEFKNVQEKFSGGRATEEEVLECIQTVFSEQGYLLDPHTAVAYVVGQKYVQTTGDTRHLMVMATAHPYKFSQTVSKALQLNPNEDTELEIKALSEYTKEEIPHVVARFFQLPKRFSATCKKNQIDEMVKKNIRGEKS